MLIAESCAILMLLFATLALGWRERSSRRAELRVMAEALRESENRLRDYSNLASDWFWEQDADLRFTKVGPASPQTGLADQQRIGSHRWDFIDIARAPEKWEQHRHDLTSRKSFRDFRYNRTGKDGRVHYVSINGIPLFDASGTFLGYRGTGRDLTEQVEAEAALREAKEKAESANRAKSAFLAQMSHELRTPLNAILGFSELIHDKTFGPVHEQYVDAAREIMVSGHKLLGVINDLIEMSQLEAGTYELKEEPVEIHRIIQACLCVAGMRAAEAHVTIQTGGDNAAVTLKADVAALIQALLNVLMNAIKFTPAGGLVSWRAEIAATGDLVFVVRDNGIGIDEAALPKIFEPFYQADSSSTRRFGGTGLGLAISRRVLALHGGSLEVESKSGQGTTARITLPASRILTQQRRGGGAAPARTPEPRRLPADALDVRGPADWLGA